MPFRLLSILVLLVILHSCEDNNKYFKVILTGEVTEIDSFGATFHAKIINNHEDEFSAYGFVWKLKNSDRTFKAFSNSMADDKFDYRIDYDLFADSLYEVQAFVVANGVEIYGASKVFKSLGANQPVLNSFQPKVAYAGDTITLIGNNFSSTAFNNEVYVGDIKLTTVNATKNVIHAIIPYETNTSLKYKLSIKITGMQLLSDDSLTIKETWKKVDENIPLRQDAFAGVDGFFIQDRLYIKYNDGYAGLFAYDMNTKTSSLKTDYQCYLPNVVFSVKEKGYLLSVKYSNCSDHLMEYHPETDLWMEKSGFPGVLREQAVHFVIGDHAYFGLGKPTFSSELLTDFWKYDTKNDLWTKVADFPGSGRLGAIGFSNGEKGYVGLGGSNNKDIWEYDPAKDKWTMITTYPGINDRNHIAITINNKLYIGRVDFWIYDFSKNQWQSRIGNFPGTTPSNGNSNIPFIFNNSIYIASAKMDNYSSRVSSYNIWKLNRN